VERLPPGQAVVSAAVEAGWGIVFRIDAGAWVPRFHGTAISVARNWSGLPLQGMVMEVVGRWSGFPPGQAVVSAVVEARWENRLRDRCRTWVLRFHGPAISVARNWSGLPLQGMVMEVVGRWSGFLQGQAVVSAVVEAGWGIVFGSWDRGVQKPEFRQTAISIVVT
jgi:hypothetical protein